MKIGLEKTSIYIIKMICINVIILRYDRGVLKRVCVLSQLLSCRAQLSLALC